MPRRHDALADLAGDLGHLLLHGGDVDGNLGPEGLEPELVLFDADLLALVGDAPLSEQLAGDVDGVAEAPYGAAVGEPVHGPDLGLVVRADAEDEAALGEVVDGGGGHADDGGAAHEDAGDAGAELDALGGEGAGGEDGELVAAAALGHPGGLVAELLGILGAFHEVGRGHVA